MKFTIGINPGDYVRLKRTEREGIVKEVHGNIIYVDWIGHGDTYLWGTQAISRRRLRKLHLKSKKAEIIRDIGKFRSKLGL